MTAPLAAAFFFPRHFYLLLYGVPAKTHYLTRLLFLRCYPRKAMLKIFFSNAKISTILNLYSILYYRTTRNNAPIICPKTRSCSVGTECLACKVGEGSSTSKGIDNSTALPTNPNGKLFFK